MLIIKTKIQYLWYPVLGSCMASGQPLYLLLVWQQVLSNIVSLGMNEGPGRNVFMDFFSGLRDISMDSFFWVSRSEVASSLKTCGRKKVVSCQAASHQAVGKKADDSFEN